MAERAFRTEVRVDPRGVGWVIVVRSGHIDSDAAIRTTKARAEKVATALRAALKLAPDAEVPRD